MRQGEKSAQEEARQEDLLRRALRGGAPVFSKFLLPDSRARLFALAQREGLEGETFGGGPEPERAVAGLWRPGCGPEHSPIAVVAVQWDSRYAAPGHRDVLGALLGLGLERDTLGDVRLAGDAAYVAALDSVAFYVTANLTSVGRAAVKASVTGRELPPPEAGQRQRINLPSLRLDAVLAQALHLPRTKAQALVQAGLVTVNWKLETRADRQAAEGDVLSIRGHGRVRVLELTGKSRKDRLFIEVETFLTR